MCEFDEKLKKIEKSILELKNETTTKILLQNGKINEAILYIKENLGEALKKLFKTMNFNGDLDELIKQTLVNGVNDFVEHSTPDEAPFTIETHRNEEMKTSYVVTIVKKRYIPSVNFTNGTIENPYSNNKNVIDYMKTVNKMIGINAGLRGVTVKNGISLIDSNTDSNEGYFILAISKCGKLQAFPRTATGTEIIEAGFKDAVNIWSPVVENGVFFDESALDSNHEDYDYIFNQKHPRQIFGVLASGDYIIITTDGRMVDEQGLNFTQIKELVREWGCVSAYNLDGGASTQTVIHHHLITRKLSESRTIGTVITFEKGILENGFCLENC